MRLVVTLVLISLELLVVSSTFHVTLLNMIILSVISCVLYVEVTKIWGVSTPLINKVEDALTKHIKEFVRYVYNKLN